MHTASCSCPPCSGYIGESNNAFNQAFSVEPRSMLGSCCIPLSYSFAHSRPGIAMRSHSRVAHIASVGRVPFRSVLGTCVSIMVMSLALIPQNGQAQGATSKVKSSVRPMIGGDANVTVYPETGNVSVSGSSTHTYSFYLENSGTGNAVAALSIIECTGAVNTCSVSPTSISLPKNGGSGTATVTYHTAATGTGQIMLFVNWGSGNNLSAILNVALPSATPSVTASQPTEWTQQNVSTGFPYFTITNTGITAATYNLTASCTNVVAGTCSVVSPTGSVAPNGTATAEVRFTTGPASGGNATAMLTATSPYGETGSKTVTIVPMSEYVSVAAQTALEPPPPAPGGSATYGFSPSQPPETTRAALPTGLRRHVPVP